MTYTPNIEELDRHIADLKQLALPGKPITVDSYDLTRIITNMQLMRDELSEFRWTQEQQRRACFK